MFFERSGLRVFVYKKEIDMRYGFERLHSICVHQMSAVMDQGHVYLFFGHNRRRLKLLFYDGSGLVLVNKRMERGNFMSLLELVGRGEIKLSELKQIFHGSVIKSPVVDRSLAASHVSTQREPFALPQGTAPSL
jgi:transposase